MSLFTCWQTPAAIILLTIAEAFALWVHHRKTGGGLGVAAFLPGLLAGDFLLAALAAALAHAWPGWIAACLLASLICHLTDLTRRWS